MYFRALEIYFSASEIYFRATKKVLSRGAWGFMECAGGIVCVAGGGFAELTIVVSKYAILRKFVAEITIFF